MTFRKLGLALAVSGLLVSMLPTAVGAASAPVHLLGHADCSDLGGNASIHLWVTWTGGTGRWISLGYTYTITEGGTPEVTGSGSEARVSISQGSYDLGTSNLGSLTYLAYPVSYSATVQLYRGSGPSPDGPPYTFSAICWD